MMLTEALNAVLAFLEPMFPVYLGLVFFMAIPIVFRLSFILVDSIHSAVLSLSGKKKSYNDEMSIYDTGQTIDQPRQPLTGISLDDLQAIAENDGEIPESAFNKKA